MPVPPLAHHPSETPVVVVFGGPSAEHDVSIVSGTAIAESLAISGYPVEQVLVDLEARWWALPADHRREGRPQSAYDDPAALGSRRGLRHPRSSRRAAGGVPGAPRSVW
jgi:D-alanine-D-alanine ligase-like ATP-grasp enzyme